MYPRNAASPEQIAIGPVVAIADGAVQTSGCAVRIFPSGGAEGDGGGTTAYSTDGIVLYTPTQAETNYASFILIAKKASCIPASVTVVTTASAMPGIAVCADTQKVDVNTIKTQAVTCGAGVTVGVYVGGTGAAALASEVTAARMGALTDWIDGGRLDLLLDATKAKTDGLNFTDTDVKATLDSEEVTPTAASKTGYALSATGMNLVVLPADIITAAAVKADAVTKIQTGLATPTNITAGTITTVTNLTNAPTNGDFTATMKTSITTSATAATPTVTLANGAHGGAAATLVLSDYSAFKATGFSTHSAADVLIALGTGTWITAIGDTRIANLDAAITSRHASGAAVAKSPASLDWEADVTNKPSIGTSTFDPTVDLVLLNEGYMTYLARLDAAVSSRQATVENLGNTVTMAAAFAAMHIASVYTAEALANAQSGGSAPSAEAIADQIWDELLAGHATAGSAGAALSAAGSSGDPWSTLLPGSYADGTAGKIIGTDLATAAGLAALAVIPTASVSETPTAGTITIRRGDYLSQAISGVGDISARTYLWFTAKTSPSRQADSAARIQITEELGLVILNGAVYVTAADGDLTVDEVAETVTITLSAEVTAALSAGQRMEWDLQILDATGKPQTIATGTLTVTADVTRAIEEPV